MKYLLDTNVWIDAIAGKLSADAFLCLLSDAEWVGFSAITRLELFGFPGISDDEEKRLSSLMHRFTESEVTSVVIDRAIDIRKYKKIKVPDAIIAATALVADCVLITRNVDDFKSIQDLAVVNPHPSAR